MLTRSRGKFRSCIFRPAAGMLIQEEEHLRTVLLLLVLCLTQVAGFQGIPCRQHASLLRWTGREEPYLATCRAQRGVSVSVPVPVPVRDVRL